MFFLLPNTNTTAENVIHNSIPDFDSLSSATTSSSRNSTGRSLFLANQQTDQLPNQPNSHTGTISLITFTHLIHMFSVQNTSLNYGIFPLNAGDFHLFLFPVGPHVFLIITGIATIVAMLAAGLCFLDSHLSLSQSSFISRIATPPVHFPRVHQCA